MIVEKIHKEKCEVMNMTNKINPWRQTGGVYELFNI